MRAPISLSELSAGHVAKRDNNIAFQCPGNSRAILNGYSAARISAAIRLVALLLRALPALCDNPGQFRSSGTGRDGTGRDGTGRDGTERGGRERALCIPLIRSHLRTPHERQAASTRRAPTHPLHLRSPLWRSHKAGKESSRLLGAFIVVRSYFIVVSITPEGDALPQPFRLAFLPLLPFSLALSLSLARALPPTRVPRMSLSLRAPHVRRLTPRLPRANRAPLSTSFPGSPPRSPPPLLSLPRNLPVESRRHIAHA